jgi:hypothetical protein
MITGKVDSSTYVSGTLKFASEAVIVTESTFLNCVKFVNARSCISVKPEIFRHRANLNEIERLAPRLKSWYSFGN